MNRFARAVLALVFGLSFSAACVEAQDKAAKPAEQYRAILKEYQEALEASSGARLGKAARQFLELAEKNPADPVALDALLHVTRVYNGTAHPAGKDSPGGKALALLLRDHAKSDKLGEVCQRLATGFRKEYEAYLRTIVDTNPHKDVQGLACLSLGQFFNNRLQRLDLVKERSDLAKQYDDLFGKDYLDELQRQDPAKVTKVVEALFEQAATKYGEVKMVAVWAGEEAKTVGEKAKAELFQIRHLSIGRQAPDIEGQDQDGKRFKLSDYRGKVLLLDFWHEF
jgi:hypothetical protein